MTGASYQTKYRPATLDDVVGQDHIKNALSATLDERAQQAFLFEGPSGTGKTTLARIAAARLGCAEIIEVDAASNTGVDDMRAVSSKADYQSFDGTGKAFIIDECHRLSRQAWESLLKAIEEPPEGVYWFFCTTEPTKIINTVRTRCMTFTLKDVPYRKLLGLIADVVKQESLDLPDDVIEAAVGEAGGSPRKALVNLATVKHAKTSEEAMAALNRAPGDAEAIDLARLLFKGFSFNTAKPILKELKDANAESVRLTVFTYAQAVVLGKGDLWAMQVMGEFEKPCVEMNRMGDIVLRVARLDFKKGKS
jgi:DNA polymerase-3 subunit gamma/tau